MQVPLLIQLLEQDGHRLERGTGVWRTTKCVNPHHNDKNPSMRVHTGNGVYKCMSCDISGNAYTYLREIRGLDNKAAWEILEAAGFRSDNIHYLERQRKAKKDPTNLRPRRVDRVPDDLGDGAVKVMEHDYLEPDGTLVMRVARYAKPTDRKKKKPKTLPHTPCSEGGWWQCGPLHEHLPDGEKRIERYPLYRVDDIHKRGKQQIWIVEGEKCADAVANCTDVPSGKPPPPVTCLCLGTPTRFDKYDLTPLHGKRLLILADGDKPGHEFALRLGRVLIEHAAQVRLLLPPADSDTDIADVIASGGWPAVLRWAKEIGPKDYAEVVKGSKEKDPDLPRLDETPYFRVLGYAQEAIIIQSKTTHRLHQLSPSRLSQDTTLMMLAPREYWREISPSRQWTTLARQSHADAIMRAAEARGFFDVSERAYGRGAAQGKFNVGSHLLTPDGKGVLSREMDLSESEDDCIFVPGKPIPLVDSPDVRSWCEDLISAVEGYRWQTVAHGRAFLGWIVSSIVGGGLPFRPMMWLTAPSASGKTFLLDRVLKRLHQGLIRDLLNASEAGMAQIMGNDSLPAYLDEFEPDPKREDRLTDVLALVRSSTSGEGARVRGSASGAVSVLRPRMSLIVVSIHRPNLQERDSNRFCHIQLGPPVSDWPKVKRAINEALTEERCAAIRTHIIRHTPQIVKLAIEMEEEALDDDVPTREAQIMGALSAGFSFLAGRKQFLDRPSVTPKAAYPPLDVLLSSLVRLSSTSEELTLAEALSRSAIDGGSFVPEHLRDPLQKEFGDLAGRYGLRWVGPSEVWIAPTAPTLRAKLRRTEWQGTNMSEYVKGLDGVEAPQTAAGARQRMTVAKQQRAVYVLPEKMLIELGLIDNYAYVGVKEPEAITEDIPF